MTTTPIKKWNQSIWVQKQLQNTRKRYTIIHYYSQQHTDTTTDLLNGGRASNEEYHGQFDYFAIEILDFHFYEVTTSIIGWKISTAKNLVQIIYFDNKTCYYAVEEQARRLSIRKQSGNTKWAILNHDSNFHEELENQRHSLSTKRKLDSQNFGIHAYLLVKTLFLVALLRNTYTCTKMIYFFGNTRAFSS